MVVPFARTAAIIKFSVPVTLTVSVEPAGIGPGFYPGTVSINLSGACAGSRIVNVSLVVGAPANFWTHLLAAAAWGFQAHLTDNQPFDRAHQPTWFGPELMSALEAAVLAKCDAADAIPGDGILQDPRKCDFDASTLTSAGFTAAQAGAVAKIYAGPRNPRTGRQIYPGLLPGAESGPGGWPAWITGAAPGGSLLDFFSTQYFANFVFTPSYNLFTFDFDRDMATNDASVGRYINAIDPDLRPLKHRGSKILMYHGFNDPAISAQNSINYYESVVKFFTGRRDTREEALGEVQEFYRLFMMPGMQHCGGGPGPNAIGAPFALPAPVMDAEHDVLSALERWVERGTPPSKLIATKYAGDNPAGGVVMQRPVCPYPQEAVFVGRRGDSTNVASNFKCRAPKGHGHDDEDDD
jgi:feruloyl esterase